VREGLHRLRALPARGVLAGAAAVAVLGTAAAVAAQPAQPVSVSTRGGDRPAASAPAPDDTAGTEATSTRTPAATLDPSTSVAAVPAQPRRSGSSAATATTTSTTAPRRPTTSTTVWDWKAAGYPGPPGTVVNPWSEAPYVRSSTDMPAYSTLKVTAPRDGAVPGSTMPITFRATWGPRATSGTVVLRGPMHNNRPSDQEATRVVDSWTGTCDLFKTADTVRTTTIDLPMRPVVLPDYTINNLTYEVWTTVTTCAGDSLPTVAYLQLHFNVTDPWVVQEPGPGLMGTG
jgi:hypothetical protein